ncbi:GtrA family protein [Bacillus sp. 31A1R]|uniref:GtrA family protein n=1 Tax=Robertmurraya mangrovi TaxID=3098077 RepID=A0ABU5J361_9BACI|nr:GtrA family protein [Bacillus sp. 31A1R]MDZ5473863.1 GtrA family protein [Bacillus sp. 31A1R]
MNHIAWNYLKPTNSFIRFLLVGILNTFIGLLTMFFLLNLLNQGYWISTFLGNAVGAMVSFLLNRTFTFNSKVSFIKGGSSFIIVILITYFFAYGLSSMISKAFYNMVDITNFISEKELAVIIGVGLYTIINYFGQKYFVFRTGKAN